MTGEGRRLPSDGKKDYEIGYGKPPVATRFQKGNRANPHGRPRGSPSLATILQRALDAPASAAGGKRRRITKREAMVRSLVERSAGANLAATKLLFEMLRRADPRAVAADPIGVTPSGSDALAILKERLARLALSQMANPSRPPIPPADPPDPSNPPECPDAFDPADPHARAEPD